jgi:putative PIN family toxin of toxin-antitoxin system
MKVVIDTNIFVMAIAQRSAFHDIFRKLKDEAYEIVVTTEILLEYEEILSRKYNEETVKFFLRLLDELENVHFIRTYYHWNLIKTDPDDNKFVDAALATGAKFLVTEDKHYNILKTIDFPRLEIINADDFLLEIKDL